MREGLTLDIRVTEWQSAVSIITGARSVTVAFLPIRMPTVNYFDNVTITAEGILFRGGEIMPETFARPENHRRWLRKRQTKQYLRDLKLDPVRKIEKAVWATDDWSKGYFHWLADVLPRLVIAAGHLKDTPLLLPARFAAWDVAKDSLALFNIDAPQFLNKGEEVSVGRLYLPVLPHASGEFDKQTINEVRRILTRSIPKDAVPERRIYITRKHARRRKIVNEAEVIDALTRRGYETVAAEELSFADQLRLFSSAREIISIHGAGLANMIFMPEGGRVTEFRKNDPRSPDHFLNMAAALGHKYLAQLCPAANEAQAPYSADLLVDTRSLAETRR